jgi:MFS family permease
MQVVNKTKLTFSLHPLVWVIIIGTFFARAGFFMTIPYLGIYLHEIKHMTPAAIGVILSASFIVSTFSGFICGPLTDRYERSLVMAGSMVLWSAVFLGFSLADSPWLFFLLNGMSGLCRATFETAAKALLTDVTNLEDRTNAFQMRYLAINIGAAVGPLLGLQMGSSSSDMALIMTSSVYLAMAFILFGCSILSPRADISLSASTGPHTTIRFRDVMAILVNDKMFRYLLIANFFIYSGYGHIDTTLAQYMGSEEVTSYSTVFIANGLIILLLQYPVIRWTKRFSAMTNIKCGTISFSIALLGFGFFHSIPLLILSAMFFSIGEILCFVIGDVIISELAPENMRGTYFGASGLAFLGQSMGAWAGGLFLNLFGFHQGGIIFTLLALLTLLALPFLQKCQTGSDVREAEQDEVANQIV